MAESVSNGQMHLLNVLFAIFTMLSDITGTKTTHIA